MNEPSTTPKTDLLTEAEHGLMATLGKAWNTWSMHVVGGGNRQDSAEFCHHIHALQNMVLAQAAARAYPGRYRLAGESLATAPRPVAAPLTHLHIDGPLTDSKATLKAAAAEPAPKVVDLMAALEESLKVAKAKRGLQ